MQSTSLVRPVGCFLMVLCPLREGSKEIDEFVMSTGQASNSDFLNLIM